MKATPTEWQAGFDAGYKAGTNKPAAQPQRSSKALAQEAEKALRFHPNPEQHDKYCKQGNINAILTSIEKARMQGWDDGYNTCRQAAKAGILAQPQRSAWPPEGEYVPDDEFVGGAAGGEHEHKTAICPFCHGSFVVDATHIMELQRGAASGTVAVAGSEQPTWACSKWGGYEHDWMECPECLEAYSKLNESIIEPPKEERGEAQEQLTVALSFIPDRETRRAVADAHESALAAEREKRAQAERDANQSRQAVIDAMSLSNEMDTNLRSQLQQAQAAMLRMVDVAYDFVTGESSIPKDNLAMELKCIVDSAADLSALLDHDAEVCRPLLEELQNIVNCDLEGMRKDFGEDTDRQFRMWAQNRARTALALAAASPSDGGQAKESNE